MQSKDWSRIGSFDVAMMRGESICRSHSSKVAESNIYIAGGMFQESN